MVVLTNCCLLVCYRSIYFTYEKPNTQKGIDVYRYTTPPEVFMYYKDNPANRGFCTPYNNCLPSGLLNMENCHDGNVQHMLANCICLSQVTRFFEGGTFGKNFSSSMCYIYMFFFLIFFLF